MTDEHIKNTIADFCVKKEKDDRITKEKTQKAEKEKRDLEYKARNGGFLGLLRQLFT
ncbi:MAG: hypothetical protein HQK84_11790 [Nitrospinae bacterium]|nr:hypothetical protein [Nitrospinota bacterium]